jgi:hypothetical protein
MQTEKQAETRDLQIRELRELLASPGPCISIYLPIITSENNLRENSVRFKHAIRRAEQLLEAKNIPTADRRALVEPIQDLANQFADHKNVESQGLAVFRSPSSFHHIHLPHASEEMVEVGRHFQIRPLLPQLMGDRSFYILALSQKNIRLLKCSDRHSEEVELPKSVPRNLDEFTETSKPDHVQDNRATGGPSTGSMKGVMFTTSSDREARDEYLHHFFVQIDRGLQEIFRNDPLPLVVVGVEYELAIYKRINTYPNSIENGVHGAPDGLKGGEMHRRALELIEPHFSGALDRALEQLDRQMGANRASLTMKEIVKAAYEGRVSHLFLTDSAKYIGTFDETRMQTHAHSDDRLEEEDLVNTAALQTILHAGQVFVTSAGKLPNGAPVAAVFRY